jgi:hypothetical protein
VRIAALLLCAAALPAWGAAPSMSAGSMPPSDESTLAMSK